MRSRQRGYQYAMLPNGWTFVIDSEGQEIYTKSNEDSQEYLEGISVRKSDTYPDFAVYSENENPSQYIKLMSIDELAAATNNNKATQAARNIVNRFSHEAIRERAKSVNMILQD